MAIVKVISIAFVGLLAVGVLKEIKPSLAAVAGIVTGLIIVYSLLDEFTYIVESFRQLSVIAEIDDARRLGNHAINNLCVTHL